MELRHEFVVPIDIETAWSAFTDVERIVPCLPGASITSVSGNSFVGAADVKLGPVALHYLGEGAWVYQDRSTYSAEIQAQGKDKRGNGTASAVITARLERVASGTRVDVKTQLKISGRPAQFGRGVIQDVGGKLLDQFAACLALRLAEQPSDVQHSLGGDTDGEMAQGDLLEGSAASSAAGQQPSPTERKDLNLWRVAGPVLIRRWGPWVLGIFALVGLVWFALTKR